MKTTINPKKSVTAALAATAAAAAVPALLFLGAGTAHAETFVQTRSDALGVTVLVVSVGPAPSAGPCTYTAVPTAPGPSGILPLPAYGIPFYLQADQIHNLWFPGIQTGATWNVDIRCDDGTDSPTHNVVY